MELATRTFSKRCLKGLDKCVETDLVMDYAEKQQWQAAKERGQTVFKTGSDEYAIFDRRPMTDVVKEYSAEDVVLLPALRDTYRAKLCHAWWRKIQAETSTRIEQSQGPLFNGKGRHMSLGPGDWFAWKPSAAEKRDRLI